MNKNKNIIKGNIAHKGIYKGRVKVVFEDDQGKKFRKGDVLVAPMTTPGFIAIMKKAGAFVTDEGGITCHAAIVAREMGKPCIVGAKIATKVFKDGDLVEVNANEGVVRMLVKLSK